MKTTPWTILEANNLLTGLRTIHGCRGVKFGYAVARNIDLLTSVLSTIHKKINEANAIKDDVQREKALEEINILGSSLCEFTPYAIKIEDVPADIPAEFMVIIYPLLEGEFK